MTPFPGSLLVGVDRSASARRAVLAAVHLARGSGAALHLVHVRLRRPLLHGQPMSPAARERADREAAELLADEAIAAREHGVEVASTHVRYADRVEHGLLDVQRELEAEVVVVGAGDAGRGVLDALGRGGDLPAATVRRAEASVLVVR